MSEPFIGEIRMFAFAFAPKGWAICNGAILNIQQNQALFSLLGTYYGGNGSTTFGLPDFRGRVPLEASAEYSYGNTGGAEQVTLTTGTMPGHVHGYYASINNGTKNNAGNDQTCVLTANGASGGVPVYLPGSPSVTLDPSGCGSVGGSQPHANLQPSLVLNFCIAIVGIFPSRT